MQKTKILQMKKEIEKQNKKKKTLQPTTKQSEFLLLSTTVHLNYIIPCYSLPLSFCGCHLVISTLQFQLTTLSTGRNFETLVVFWQLRRPLRLCCCCNLLVFYIFSFFVVGVARIQCEYIEILHLHWLPA